jgi:hypothetical protein
MTNAMSIPDRDPTGSSTPVWAPIAPGSSPALLTELALDCVTGAGSKPGMVGDGRQIPQLRQMR